MATYDPQLKQIVEQLNRATPSGRMAESAVLPLNTAGSRSLDLLLAAAADRNASDVLLVAGTPPVLRVNGTLLQWGDSRQEPDDIRSMMLPLLSPSQVQELQTRKAVDFCFERGELGRFRANLHHQRGTLAASVRLLPARVPSLEFLHLPLSLARLAERRQGLILVTGPTGSGKSSTLAALIDLINTRRTEHIVTIEDPIEFLHANRNSIVEQIEVGRDTPGFNDSLRSILRQSPDVILIGEMRDPDTIALVLTAAETGHLVLSTLHTNDAPQTISRILDSFPAARQLQVRQQLSLALLAVIAQQLTPAIDRIHRYPALEVMTANDAVRNLIRRGEDHQLRSQITIGRADGMITMEQSLADLVRWGRITRETAIAHCFRPDDLTHMLT